MEGVTGRVLAAVAAGLLLAGCGGGAHRAAGANGVAASAAPVVNPPPHRSPPSRLLRLRAALTRALKQAGPQAGAVVLDLGRDQTLYAASADVKRPPASVEKLYTTIALLREFGPGLRLATTVLGTGHLDTGGTWHGDLYLRGGGDPSFGDGTFNRAWEFGYGPTAADLAGQLRADGIRQVTGRLIPDESLFDSRRGGPATGYAPDIPDFGGQLSALSFDHGSATPRLSPAAFAARQLARTLRSQHVRVSASAEARRTPRHARPLAQVQSPPLSVLLKLMDVPSDDLFAELLTKQMGVRAGEKGTTAAGAGVISTVISSYGLNPHIVDGSGLSRADRSSPREVVDLLARVWRTPEGRALARSLPTVGVNGTVRGVAVGTPAQGRCIAKTGTLDNVTNLAGYCATRSRRMLAFALFLDGIPDSRALVLLGRMVAAIASY